MRVYIVTFKEKYKEKLQIWSEVKKMWYNSAQTIITVIIFEYVNSDRYAEVKLLNEQVNSINRTLSKDDKEEKNTFV